ncbi:hypothetical protein BDK51DRAFT_36761 [Blyttiomyces helicus]|uniref:Uncharacterized protein n=1 Tax=Blyttiomyces helicus TaxID=388810 RepID=A0A4P9WQH0_9FUNG|nr:hypothetical protein BDK51DRAFT_36761 [Blyttiomyces helicus]|eukprot:RKO94058.1 hypothetical protein BDK51DRAFT_36761 [Blyttiomyces helicus]
MPPEARQLARGHHVKATLAVVSPVETNAQSVILQQRFQSRYTQRAMSPSDHGSAAGAARQRSGEEKLWEEGKLREELWEENADDACREDVMLKNEGSVRIRGRVGSGVTETARWTRRREKHGGVVDVFNVLPAALLHRSPQKMAAPLGNKHVNGGLQEAEKIGFDPLSRDPSSPIVLVLGLGALIRADAWGTASYLSRYLRASRPPPKFLRVCPPSKRARVFGRYHTAGFLPER